MFWVCASGVLGLFCSWCFCFVYLVFLFCVSGVFVLCFGYFGFVFLVFWFCVSGVLVLCLFDFVFLM